MSTQPIPNEPDAVAFSEPRWHFWLPASLLGLVLLRFLLFAIAMAFLLPIRSDITFPEGAVVAHSLDVAKGLPAYPDWREWPHRFAPYGPLTYYPVGWMASVAPGAADPWSVYLLGRIQSFLGLAVIAICVLVIGRSLKLGWWWCLAAVFLFCAWEQVFSFVASYRPDAPQVAFSLLALAVMMRRRPDAKSIVLVLFLISCAMWFKPAAWGSMVCAAIWMWPGGGLRALIALALFGAANLAVALALNFQMDGRLLLNMVESLDNGFVAVNVAGFYRRLPLESLAIFLGGGLVLLAVVRASQSRQDGSKAVDFPVRFLALATSISWGSSTVLNLKEGADVNYYLETYVLLCVLIVWGIWTGYESGRVRNPARTIMVGSAILLWAVWELAYAMNGYPAFLRSLRAGWKVTGVEEFVQHAYPGPMYTTNPFLALARNAEPALLDQVQFEILVRRGKLNSRGLIDRIKSEDFELIVLSGEDWKTPREGFICAGFDEALRSHYRFDGPIGGLVALRPIRGGK